MSESQEVQPQHPADVALEALRRHQGGSPHAATTDLSVDEAILLDETGYEPVGIVSGSTVFHIGYSGMFNAGLGNQEMTQISQAMAGARELALQRLQQEAETIRGTGVVGVRLTIRILHGSSMAEFFAMGTAVRPRESHALESPVPFFTSDLNGQEFYLLHRAGYMPVGLVMGSCVYHVQYRTLGQWFRQATANVELTNFTEAIYNAREIAMTRLEDEVQRLGADGVVGMHIHEESHLWGNHVIEYFALGTAIKLIKGEHQTLDVRASVSLNDPDDNIDIEL